MSGHFVNLSGTAIIRFYYRLKHKLEAVFYCWKIVKALSLMNNNKSYKKEEVVIMKKKMMAAVLTMAMAVAAMAGCGSNSASNDAATTEKAAADGTTSSGVRAATKRPCRRTGWKIWSSGRR